MKKASISVPPKTQLFSKALATCQLVPYDYRLYAYRSIIVTSCRKYKAGCFVTGRHRGYVSAYGVSRLIFKAYAMHGVYSGVKKFVW
jgi:ribosomal protein S14